MALKRKYQVFISSTFDDLRIERQLVTWALLKARHIPVGMEAFSATDDRGWRIISATIDDSDYYVLILAGKLGSVDTTTGLSWTRREYEYARSVGVPILAFVRDIRTITADKMESVSERVHALKEFTGLVETTHHRERWSDGTELISNVTTALSNQIQDDELSGHGRPGWYRGNLTSGIGRDADVGGKGVSSTQQVSDAVGLLGHDKIEVRVGAVYSLESVATMNEQLRPTIVETLCSFLRTNTARRINDHQRTSAIPITDLQAAFTVIGRMPPSRAIVDLRKANLSHLDANGANLGGARLTHAVMAHCDLTRP